jgi:hypothetical protein
MLGGVGRRALAGTEHPEAQIAKSDQPSAAEAAMPKAKPLVQQLAGKQFAGRIKSVKLKMKFKAGKQQNAS